MLWRLCLLVLPLVCACSLTIDEIERVIDNVPTASEPDVPSIPDPDEIIALDIEDGTVALTVGDKIDLTVVATYGDDSSAEVTGEVTWIVDDGDVVSVNNKGVLKAKSEGEAAIVATLDGIESSPLTVEVANVPFAELYVSELDVQDNGNGGASVDFTVTNSGSKKASSFWVDVFVNPDTTPSVGDVGVAFEDREIAAGKSAIFHFDVDTGSGTHQLYVLVDSTDDVEEANEDNNLESTSVSVAAVALPDLVTSFSAYCDYNYDIHYEVTVENLGGATGESFEVAMFLDEYLVEVGDVGDETQTIYGMGAGEVSYLDFVLPAVCWYCDSWAFVDIDDDIDESNESNNDYGSTVYVSW
ncbi:MAG: hypothetical protein HN348_08855 [Proteobacteria bacterium]|jgi:hypothetical protein|nr:hypothetical protein [Pseudomonadota bacterium]